MTEQAYIEPSVVESDVSCAAVSRLPQLPIRGLILAHVSVAERREGRTIAARIRRAAEDLGVGEAVVLEEREWRSWAELAADPPTERFDIVLVRSDGLDPDTSELDDPHPRYADVLARLLESAEARFWTLDQSCFPEVLAEQEGRTEALCRQVVARGGPPAVRLPGGWTDAERNDFLVALFEHALHDAPLLSGAERAWDRELALPPRVFLPSGRRHGLDLARLLEDHRNRLEECGIALRIFQREVEAARPQDPDAEGRWAAVCDSVKGRQERLVQLNDSCAEIGRDRDPAGWSRLAADIDEVRRLEAAVQGDRDRLAAISASGGDSSA